MAQQGHNSKGRKQISQDVSPDLPLNEVLDTVDHGDDTQHRFRYQHAYGVILLLAALSGKKPYTVLWCEHYEDLLGERTDGLFDAYQIKTRRDGSWNLLDDALNDSIKRFIQVEQRFSEQIKAFFFVSNAPYENSNAQKKIMYSPKKFLQAVKHASSPIHLTPPFDKTFEDLRLHCDCDPPSLLAVLKKLDLLQGPGLDSFKSEICQLHLSVIHECHPLSAEALAQMFDRLIARVSEASCLDINDPVRHWYGLNEDDRDNPKLQAKRIPVDSVRTFIRENQPRLLEPTKLDDTGPGTKQFTNGPGSHIPFPRNSLFQPRPGEFEQLEHLLLKEEKKQCAIRIGLIGMGGVGKTQLAVVFSYRCLDQHRFAAGIFWMTATGSNLLDWQTQFAELALKTRYLPPDDDISSSENERRRAMHFCRYLADHDDALLILDNVEDPFLMLSVLPTLAGRDVACSILYTSRNRSIPEGVVSYFVKQLSEEGALNLLLNAHRPLLLSQVVAGSLDEESCAAREICRGVRYLPLALVHLRGWLIRDVRVTLVRLKGVLIQRGALELGKEPYRDAVPLFATFRLSWEKITSDEARRVFNLASYFPEAAPIQRWLLGLAAGLGEQGDIFEPLGRACLQLQELSLLEVLSEDQVWLHPLVRAFGQQLSIEEGDKGKNVLTEAGERLVTTFIDLNKLEQRALQEGYWECLRQIQSVRTYAALISARQERFIELVERWLDREGYLLANQKWWPDILPGLFYQQLFNRTVEENSILFVGEAPAFWLRQLNQVGAEDSSQIRVFAGHTDRVTSVAFSPDGKQILTGSNDQTARLWDTTNGQVLLILENHTAEVNSVAFSPDSKQLLTTASDGAAIVWNAADGQILRRLEGHRDVVANIHYTYRTILVSHPVTHQLLLELEGYTHAEVELESSSDGIVLLRNKLNGQILAELPKCASEVTSGVFSPDGSKILTGSTDRTARLWDTTSGQVLLILEGHIGVVNSVAFSPDGSKILTGSTDRTARLWDTTSGQVLLELKGHSAIGVDSVAFSPDGSKVLTGSWDGTARLWDTTSGQLLLILEDHGNWERGIDCVAFSPDSKKALIGSIDGTAQLWDLAGEKLLMTFKGHAGSYIRSIAFSPDGRYALSGSDDETARLWSIGSEQVDMVSEDQTSAIESLNFSPDGRKLLIGSWDGIGQVLDTTTGQVLTTLEGHTSFILRVAFSPDGIRALTCSHDGTTRIWDTTCGQSLHILESNGIVGVFSTDGTKLLTVANDADDPMLCTIWIWDIATWQLLITLKSDTSSIVSAAFSADGQRVLTGSHDGLVQMWDITNGQLLMDLEDHTSQVDSVSFSPNDQWMLTGSQDGTVRLWDAKSGQLLLILESGNGRASFSPDGRWILTFDGPKVFFWQIIGQNRAQLLGLFVATYLIGDLYWADTNSVILADTGGPRCHPHFYYLKLEGTW